MVEDFKKPVDPNKPVASELPFQFPLLSDFPSLFQIFFLSPDQSQSVEILETREIDFEEIIERVKAGESVFIKNKHPKLFESGSTMNETDKQNFGFFAYY
jgi:hypothetical protein